MIIITAAGEKEGTQLEWGDKRGRHGSGTALAALL